MHDDLAALTEEILRFRDDRNWGQFHTPRNLAAALSIEAGELQESMLWKTDEEIGAFLAGPSRVRLERELADVMIYALLLGQATGTHVAQAIRNKLIENGVKYPVSTARGRATKYTELPT